MHANWCKKVLLKNVKIASEASTIALMHYRKNVHKMNITRNELSELNDDFEKLDNSVSELFFEVFQLNKNHSINK